MTERAQQLMQQIWDCRNNQGADTEEKLVAAILKVTAETVKFYQAQNDILVLDKNDLLQLAEELEQ
jgi:hypothetical protein